MARSIPDRAPHVSETQQPELPADVLEGLTEMFVDRHGRDPTPAEVAEWAAALQEESMDRQEAAKENVRDSVACCGLCARRGRIHAAPESAGAIASRAYAAAGTEATTTPTGDVLMQNKVIVVSRRPFASKPFLWIHECTLIHSRVKRGCNLWSCTCRTKRIRTMIPLQHITGIELQYEKEHKPILLVSAVAAACFGAFLWIGPEFRKDMKDTNPYAPLVLQSLGAFPADFT